MAILLVAVNIYNFVDVMDGLLCTLAAVAAGGLLLAPGLLSGHSRAEVWLLVAGLAGVFTLQSPAREGVSGRRRFTHDRLPDRDMVAADRRCSRVRGRGSRRRE